MKRRLRRAFTSNGVFFFLSSLSFFFLITAMPPVALLPSNALYSPNVKKVCSSSFPFRWYLNHMEMLKSSEQAPPGQAVSRLPRSTHPVSPSNWRAWPLSPFSSRITPPCALPQPSLLWSFKSSVESRGQYDAASWYKLRIFLGSPWYLMKT